LPVLVDLGTTAEEVEEAWADEATTTAEVGATWMVELVLELELELAWVETAATEVALVVWATTVEVAAASVEERVHLRWPLFWRSRSRAGAELSATISELVVALLSTTTEVVRATELLKVTAVLLRSAELV
jgi:hypothetical protein